MSNFFKIKCFYKDDFLKLCIKCKCLKYYKKLENRLNVEEILILLYIYFINYRVINMLNFIECKICFLFRVLFNVYNILNIFKKEKVNNYIVLIGYLKNIFN